MKNTAAFRNTRAIVKTREWYPAVNHDDVFGDEVVSSDDGVFHAWEEIIQR